jgi:hypothetical protein
LSFPMDELRPVSGRRGTPDRSPGRHRHLSPGRTASGRGGRAWLRRGDLVLTTHGILHLLGSTMPTRSRNGRCSRCNVGCWPVTRPPGRKGDHPTTRLILLAVGLVLVAGARPRSSPRSAGSPVPGPRNWSPTAGTGARPAAGGRGSRSQPQRLHLSAGPGRVRSRRLRHHRHAAVPVGVVAQRMAAVGIMAALSFVLVGVGPAPPGDRTRRPWDWSRPRSWWRCSGVGSVGPAAGVGRQHPHPGPGTGTGRCV